METTNRTTSRLSETYPAYATPEIALDPTSTLQCPCCAEENRYVHFSGLPVYRDGHDDYRAAPGMVRGDTITIPMYCEGGHKFDLVLGSHKGYVIVWGELTGFEEPDTQELP